MRLADAISSSRSRGLGGPTSAPVFDAPAGAAPATISTSHDGCAETSRTEALPEKQERSAVVAGQSGERAVGPAAAAAASSSASSSDVRTFPIWQAKQAAQREASPGTEHKNRARTWLGGGFEDAPQDESSDRSSLSLGQMVSTGVSLNV
jgi:hypothetical protein